MRTGQIACDRCKEHADENYAAQNGWMVITAELIAGAAYPFRRDLCAKCAGEVLEFVG